MNNAQDKTPRKGVSLVAAYRAERLSQRPLLRASLQQSHAALRNSRETRRQEPDRATETDATDTSSIEAPRGVPEQPPAQSIFANLVSLSLAERAAEIINAVAAPAVDLAAQTEEQDTIAADPETPTQAAPSSVPDDPPLAEIGFGPGMLIRLSHIGVNSTCDLANANAAKLREALGDISRLIDVETWIRVARETTVPK